MDFALVIVGGKLKFNVGAPDSAVTGLSNVATGRWMHIAVTRRMSSGAVQVFVNAKLEVTGTSNTVPLNSVPTLYLGGTPQGDLLLVGLMDELRLWGIVRTQAEIESAMHHHLVGDEPGLVGYYRFDDTSAAAFADSSPRANTAFRGGLAVLVPSNAPLCEADATGGAGGETSAGGTGLSL